MKRRRAREYALQILFQLDMGGSELTDQIWTEFWENNEEDEEVKEFTRDIVASTQKHIPEIDKAIIKAAENWSIERMAVIDRNILRSATYELLYRKDVPPPVVINEALEIAKKYSTEGSAPFINGILDKIAHTISPEPGRKKSR